MQCKRIVSVIVIFVGLASCTLFKTSCLQRTGDSHARSDDSLSVVYSDSIDDILWDADRVRVYEMADFVTFRDSVSQNDSLFNYEVKRDVGVLEKDKDAILSFIISDKDWYVKNYAPIRHPFHPNIILEFTVKGRKAFMLLSFGSEEVAISDASGNFKYYRMKNERLIARWACLIFPNEEYYKNLIEL